MKEPVKRRLSRPDRNAFFTLEQANNNMQGFVKMYVSTDLFIAQHFLFKLYRQVVGIAMGTYHAQWVAYLFWVCCEVAFISSLSDKQADIFNVLKLHIDI